MNSLSEYYGIVISSYFGRIGFLCNFYLDEIMCSFLRKLSELLTRGDFAHLCILNWQLSLLIDSDA